MVAVNVDGDGPSTPLATIKDEPQPQENGYGSSSHTIPNTDDSSHDDEGSTSISESPMNGGSDAASSDIVAQDSSTNDFIAARNARMQFICTGVTILFWYGVSDTIILTTKWLFNKHFSFPLTVTVYSNFVAFLWAALVSSWMPHHRPPLTRTQFWDYVLPIGLCTALEIGSSNLALKILTVSFGTILKGGGPVFTFLWGLCFGIEAFSVKIGASLLMIAIGIALASLGEGQEFELFGFCLQLSSSALGGLRWAMTHKLLKGGIHDQEQRQQEANDRRRSNGRSRSAESGTTGEVSDGITRSDQELPQQEENDGIMTTTATSTANGEYTQHNSQDEDDDDEEDHVAPLSPLGAIFYTSPMTSLGVLPFALALESTHVWNKETTSGETVIILSTMTLIATLVFILLMSEYWLVNMTSSLALSVAGVFKELILIGGGIFFFADKIDLLNVVGFAICQGGILSYFFLRYKKNNSVGVDSSRRGSSSAGSGERRGRRRTARSYARVVSRDHSQISEEMGDHSSSSANTSEALELPVYSEGETTNENGIV